MDIFADNRTRPPPMIDIERLRRRLGMSQARFARRFGFPVATLRHWERGDRTPRGAALVLLQIIERNPGAVLRVLASCRRREDERLLRE